MHGVRAAGSVEPESPSPSAPRENPDTSDKPVTTLLDGYRDLQSAWLLEADLLARLRDQVQEAADRERVEILTKARRRIQDVMTSARRELLVLGEQVQAAVGDHREPARDLVTVALRAEQPTASTQTTLVADSTPISAPDSSPQEPLEDLWADFRSLP